MHTQSSYAFIDVNAHHLHILFKVSPVLEELRKKREKQNMQSWESVFDISFFSKGRFKNGSKGQAAFFHAAQLHQSQI